MNAQTCPRRIGEYGPWETREGIDSWNGEAPARTCSFCGSLHPDDVLAAIENGGRVVPTDKNYKMYLDAPSVGPHLKVYFQHFEEKHKDRLIEACNAGKVTFAVPGYFYRLPFFMHPKEREA